MKSLQSNKDTNGDKMTKEIIDMFFVKKECPKCEKNTHEPVSGEFTLMGDYLVQRHCSNCHHTDVTNHMTGKVRDGILKDRW